MSDEALTVYFLETCGLLAALIAALVAYRRAELLCYRQELFAARNALWDQMRIRGLLQHPSHLQTRNLFNGAIRWAEDTNLWAIFWLFTLNRKDVLAPADPTLKMPSEEAAQEVLAAQEKLIFAIGGHLFLWTLPGAVIGWPVVAVVIVRRWLTAARQFGPKKWVKEWLIEGYRSWVLRGVLQFDLERRTTYDSRQRLQTA